MHSRGILGEASGINEHRNSKIKTQLLNARDLLRPSAVLGVDQPDNAPQYTAPHSFLSNPDSACQRCSRSDNAPAVCSESQPIPRPDRVRQHWTKLDSVPPMTSLSCILALARTHASRSLVRNIAVVFPSLSLFPGIRHWSGSAIRYSRLANQQT
ncbi:hypothetical protein CSKR_106841 [Clonorchis sinensis]|uniref:Uncharacterized protein n=1 Tax=Clonorchis sinensis TaxID=79923 RepID=A0A3R7FTH8_CLOSI|nr:hypothetical protein CSKR_106841 [Clonorchis sinensis]